MRVIILEQELGGQVEILPAEGCEIVRSEKLSFASRVGLSAATPFADFLPQ